MQVIIQEDNRVIWATKGTKLYGAAPEHVRPLSLLRNGIRVPDFCQEIPKAP